MKRPTPRLEIDLLSEPFAVVRLAAGTPLPDWLPDAGFTSVTRTRQELSVVCAEGAVPAGAAAHGGLRCLSVRGPLDFSAVGILESVAHPLAAAGVSIFAVSTYDTDYVLVQDHSLDAALSALTQAGHRVHEPSPPTSSP